MNHKKVKVTLGEPVKIAQASPDIRYWGPYQFPEVNRLSDGTLHCSYHVEEDTIASFGKDRAHAVSYDEGKTWQAAPVSAAVTGGLVLPNGDRLVVANKAANRPKPEELPEIVAEAVLNSGRVTLYDPDDLPQEYSARYLCRQKAGSNEWVEERHDIHIPYEVRLLAKGLMPYPNISRLRLAPDGTLWMLCYPYTYRAKRTGMAAVFAVSKDNGYTWQYLSSIYYDPDPGKDFYWALRTGYTEPDIAFLPDGTLMCFVRTDDSFHRGPSYCAYSSDGGKTWTKPEVFDDRGVWPCYLTLKNQVTLLGYGRPGLFLRVTADTSGREWEERIPIVSPYQGDQRDWEDCAKTGKEDLHAIKSDYENTCAYCDLYPLSDDTAYLVYSDFEVEDAEGRKCKTIVGRTVTVEVE